MWNELMARLTVAALNGKDDESGQTLVEYALIISLVSIFLITALGLLADDIEAVFTDITTAL